MVGLRFAHPMRRAWPVQLGVGHARAVKISFKSFTRLRVEDTNGGDLVVDHTKEEFVETSRGSVLPLGGHFVQVHRHHRFGGRCVSAASCGYMPRTTITLTCKLSFEPACELSKIKRYRSTPDERRIRICRYAQGNRFCCLRICYPSNDGFAGRVAVAMADERRAMGRRVSRANHKSSLTNCQHSFFCGMTHVASAVHVGFTHRTIALT